MITTTRARRSLTVAACTLAAAIGTGGLGTSASAASSNLFAKIASDGSAIAGNGVSS